MKKSVLRLAVLSFIFTATISKVHASWSCQLEDLGDGNKKIHVFKNGEELIYTRSLEEGKQYTTSTEDNEEVELICNTSESVCQKHMTVPFGAKMVSVDIGNCHYMCHPQAGFDLDICHEVKK